jgi:hypothetical protein
MLHWASFQTLWWVGLILTLLTSKEVPWNFTCKACLHIPTRTLDDDGLQIEENDYQGIGKTSKITGNEAKRNLRWPVRCRSCDTENRRYHRMVVRLKKIYAMSEGIGQFQPTFRMPKLITFALPSVETIEWNAELEVSKLEKLLPQAREILTSFGILGGTYVIECTTRLIWTDLACEMQRWKHHAHVHMVAVAPYMNGKKMLLEFCESLMPIGLGRINYKSPKGKWIEFPGVKFYLTAEKQVAKYIGKYLVKDNRSSRTFGIMRGKEELFDPLESATDTRAVKN